MWTVLCVLAVAVNVVLTMAVGVGDLQGATALGFIVGQTLGLPALVGALLAIHPSNRNLRSFSKAFFWVSVLGIFANLGKLGQAVKETSALLM